MFDLGLRVLLRNVAATLARQFGSSLVQLLVIVIVARIFGPAGNGAYALALLLPTLLATLLNLGIGPANVYYIGSGMVSAKVAVSVGIRYSLLLGSAGLLVGGVCTALWRESLFPGVDGAILWVALAILPLSLIQKHIGSIFQGLQSFKDFNLILLAHPALTLIFLVAIVLSGRPQIEHAIIAYGVALLVTVVIAFWRLRSHLRAEDAQYTSASYGRVMFTYGRKAHLSNILTFLTYKADIFLINLFMSPAAAGIYVVAVNIAERLWMLSEAVSTVILPRLSQLSSHDLKRNALTPLVCRWVFAVTFGGAVAVASVSYWLVLILFGPEYLGAVVAFLALLPGIIALSGSRILANDISARGRPDLTVNVAVITLLANLFGNALLIPLFGILGAAIATTISYLANLAVWLVIYRRLSGNRPIDSLLLKVSDLELLLAAGRASFRR